LANSPVKGIAIMFPTGDPNNKERIKSEYYLSDLFKFQEKIHINEALLKNFSRNLNSIIPRKI